MNRFLLIVAALVAAFGLSLNTAHAQGCNSRPVAQAPAPAPVVNFAPSQLQPQPQLAAVDIAKQFSSTAVCTECQKQAQTAAIVAPPQQAIATSTATCSSGGCGSGRLASRLSVPSTSARSTTVTRTRTRSDVIASNR